jgi:membrane protein required for colicin V production
MESTGLQAYDILMLIVLVGTVIFGFWKGMAWQLASLASVVVSALVAVHFGGTIAPWFSAQEPWNRYIAMLVLYLATSLGIWLLFRIVAGALDRVRLKEFDRQLGALFGLAKGVLLCVVITFFAVTLSEAVRQKVLVSHSGRYIAILIKNATPVLPEDVRKPLGQYIDELDRKLDPTTPAQNSSLGGLDFGKTDASLTGLRQGVTEDVQRAIDQSADQATGEVNSRFDKLRDNLNRGLDELRKGSGAEKK